MSEPCREIILRYINEDLVPMHGDRFLYNPPKPNASPIPERAAARDAAAAKKLAERNPGKWPVGFDFSTLNDQELVDAFARMIRRSSGWR